LAQKPQPIFPQKPKPLFHLLLNADLCGDWGIDAKVSILSIPLPDDDDPMDLCIIQFAQPERILRYISQSHWMFRKRGI
jgi:hypothetical protein